MSLADNSDGGTDCETGDGEPGSQDPLASSSAGESAPPRRRRRAHSGAFVIHTAACVGKSSKDLYSAAASELGWREKDLEPKVGPASSPRRPIQGVIFCVMQTADMVDRLPTLGSHCWVTRYLGCPDLCDKGNFARMVLACQDLCEPGTWDFNPRTWVLPDQLEALRGVLEKSKKTYIVKPDDGSQGDGIYLVQGVRDLDVKLSTKANKAAVVQRYLEKPLLLGGVKFDLRLYIFLAGGSTASPPQVFVCREGLGRFCTEKYDEPSLKNMHKCMAHLTNYSLNKRSDKFEHCGETLAEVFSPDSSASKRPLTSVLRQIKAEHPAFEQERFYESVASLVQTTVAAMAPALAAYYHGHGLAGEMRCCQLLGFDVILDELFRPFLLEVNNSPSLCIDEALPLDPAESRLQEHATRTGRPREREGPGKVCLCMDMSQPHTHQTSLVDLVVKRTAMCGAFRLLEQLKGGSEQPEVDDYISVDLADTQLYGPLHRACGLYLRGGGAAKVFTTSGLRRLLGPVCGKGTLDKHDLDMLSQRFRSTQFVARDRGAKIDTLRLFDFVEVLRQVAARCFPGASSASAFNQLLDAVGD